MADLMKYITVEEKMLSYRGQYVIIDSDVAELYDVQTREINQAVKNNPNKFPTGFILELSKTERLELVKNFDRFGNLKHSSTSPKAFTEKGLYMLATILKSEKATERTIEIVETYAKMRELSRTVALLSEAPDEEKQKTLMQRSGEIMSDILGRDLKASDTETSIELNFAVLKFKHTVKRKGE